MLPSEEGQWQLLRRDPRNRDDRLASYILQAKLHGTRHIRKNITTACWWTGTSSIVRQAGTSKRHKYNT